MRTALAPVIVVLSVFAATASSAATPAEDCKKALEGARKKVEERKPNDRLRTALVELADACPKVFGALATVAKKAAEEDRAHRSQLLARAVAADIGGKCIT